MNFEELFCAAVGTVSVTDPRTVFRAPLGGSFVLVWLDHHSVYTQNTHIGAVQCSAVQCSAVQCSAAISLSVCISLVWRDHAATPCAYVRVVW
eukprot:COSAG02_NODE_1015_length_15191_cov_6.937450_4_plen_93_part_00